VLEALRDRNNLDTSKVDDVVLGCVAPVGEQGADIARTAVLTADYAESVAGVQINRFCASGLEAVNMAAAKVASGEADLAIGGGVESMSRVPMGSDGGAWPTDPSSAFKTYFAPQGVSADLIASLYGFSRDDVDAYAVESQKRAAASWADGRFKKSVVGVKDQLGLTILDHDETVRGEHHHADPGLAERLVPGHGRHGLRRRGHPALSAGGKGQSTSTTPATARASSTAPPAS
jgi:acetyl-CoA C-acetyltransferase